MSFLVPLHKMIRAALTSFVCWVLFALASPNPSLAQMIGPERSQERTLQDLINACRAYPVTSLQNPNMRLCRFITDLEQIGADVIEIIKTVMPLGPFEYFVFTWVNFQSTGRLRAQLQPIIHPKIRNVVEYRREGEFWILLSFEW